MKIKTVEEAWVLFSNGFDRSAPEIQRSEMKKAFYAGAGALFVMVINNLSEGDEVKPEDLTMMDNIHNELKTQIEAWV